MDELQNVFFKELCTYDNLFRGWLHVRSRARKSPSLAIREATEDFESKSHSKLKSIQSRIAKKTYAFPPAEGILKKRTGKEPRPIVLADLESRIVQRAILQCLQPAKTSPLYNAIGRLKDIHSSAVNFGGTPNGGVPKAIKSVMQSINDGHSIYFKSDIASFFTKVPHGSVVDFIDAECGDNAFSAIFKRALSIQLKNEADLKQYLRLFPSEEFGVPQGSALSALAGNIFLQEVDELMSLQKDIRFFRYIDDVIILGRTNEATQTARSILQNELRKRRLSLYDPSAHPTKAGAGHIRDGFEYLGCFIQRNQIEPAKSARSKVVERVATEIEIAKTSISSIRTSTNAKRTREMAFAQAINSVDEILRGWANSFRFVNNRLAFRQVDQAIAETTLSFHNWFLSLDFANEAERSRALGVFLATDTEYKKIEDY